MTRFVLDSSVAASWCFEDEANPYGEAILDRLHREEALVPALWPLQIGNVLCVAERSGRISKAQAARLLELLQRLPIAVDHGTAERGMDGILSLAREQGLSVYDACYLELAMREGLPIATRNDALREAARRSGVALARGARPPRRLPARNATADPPPRPFRRTRTRSAPVTRRFGVARSLETDMLNLTSTHEESP